MAAHDYDVSLRHATVRAGEWVGFRLAWRGLGGLDGVGQPHLRSRLWAPSDPYHPETGSPGSWVWTLYVAIHMGLVGLRGRYPEDGYNDPSDMLGWMRGYVELPAVELQ